MITDSFDDKTPPVVSLSDFYGERKHIVDVCIILFSKQIYDHVLKTFECEKIAEISAANGSTPIWKFRHSGIDIGFYLTGIGSTLAAQFCIEANWMTGATRFIMFGSAGSLPGWQFETHCL